MSNIKLQITNLNKSFSSKQILKDLNFQVFSGEFLSILGPSGCGKTTLLRILIGLEKADSGIIQKENVDITNLHPSKRGMGIVFQNYALFENMTVLQNVEYALLHNKDYKGKYTKDQVFVNKIFTLPNYPTDIPYGDMSNNTTDEKTRLLGKWMY